MTLDTRGYLLILTIFSSLGAPSPVRAAEDEHFRIVTFDVPGAGSAVGQGTYAVGINEEGAIEGISVDANYVAHGFLRSSSGAITTFDVPGAVNTIPQGLNAAKAITGFYTDASQNQLAHGFVRASDGALTTFDVPGAGTGFQQGTIAANINPAGTIAGYYLDGTIIGYVLDANSVHHGFLRARDGAITTFDVPGSGTSAGQGTMPLSNNPAGTIAGQYIDANSVVHGFLLIPR